MRILLDQVPLVHRHDEPAAAVPGEPGDLEVLVAHAFVRVDDEQADVGPINGSQGAHHGVVLDARDHAAPTAQTRRVDEDEAPAVVLERRIDRVPRGPRLPRDHQAIAAQHPVDEARLADVGPPDHR